MNQTWNTQGDDAEDVDSALGAAIERSVEAIFLRRGQADRRFIRRHLRTVAAAAEDAAEKHLISQLVSASEVAEELDITTAWVKRLAERIEVGGKVGSFWVFLPSDVEKLRKAAEESRPGRPPVYD